MSPILVRPVREQLEHDRVIRLLQAKYKRKFEVGINPGNEQTAPVGTAPSVWYPDLVLQSTERTHKLLGTVEVETAESVNNLEAMSEWGTFSRLRAPFHLYVPAACIDSTRRLCADLQIAVAELWAYHTVGDQIRFTLVHRVPQPGDGKPEAKPDGKVRPVAETVTVAPPPAARPPAKAPAVAAKPASATKSVAAKSATTKNGGVSRAAAPRAAAARGRASRPAASTTRRSAAGATAARRKPAATKTKTAAPRRPAAKAPARKGGAAAARTAKRR